MDEPKTKICPEENEIIDWLIYRSYEFQRKNNPNIKAESWRKLYYNQEIYEKIYNGEIQCH